jgi:anti-sigma factor RsiW
MSAISPMRCGEAASYLSALADGELDASLRERVQAHVAGCEACTREVARHQTINALIAALPASRPAPQVLDNVLAAAGRARSEPVTRESLRRPRRLLPRSLPAFLTAGVADAGPPARWQRKTRLSGALSALAAVLLISLSFLAFTRLPQHNQPAAHIRGQRPMSVAAVLAETRARVSAVRGQVPFMPVLPTYLPPGAQLQDVSVATTTPTLATRYLNVTWNLPEPLTLLHLRESAERLSARADYTVGQSTPALAWSLGTYQWAQGHVPYALTNWAVGEDRGTLSITLDVGVQHAKNLTNAADPNNNRAISVLRLTSLALDAPYQPLTVQPLDAPHSVLHYEAQAMTAAGAATWQVYYDPAGQREQLTVRLANGRTAYTDVIVGGSVLRLDLIAKTYSHRPASAGDFMPLRSDVTTFFNNANSLLADGELWNLGLTQHSGRHVYKLALVGAPYPTYVYVDSGTLRVIGAEVAYKTPLNRGAQAISRLSPTNACPSYSTIEFEAPGSVPSSIFSTQVPKDYVAGQVPLTLTCIPTGS